VGGGGGGGGNLGDCHDLWVSDATETERESESKGKLVAKNSGRDGECLEGIHDIEKVRLAQNLKKREMKREVRGNPVIYRRKEDRYKKEDD